MEKSYRKISLNEAARILYLTKPEEVKEIGNKVTIDSVRKNFSMFRFQHGWKLNSDQAFHFADNQNKAENEHVPADEIASQMIQYAREMEIII